MDVLDQPWLVFTWYLVLQNILLDLLCLLIFIHFHSPTEGLLPPSSLARGHPRFEKNICKANYQGVSDAVCLVWVFGSVWLESGYPGAAENPQAYSDIWCHFGCSSLLQLRILHTSSKQAHLETLTITQ